jgi:hypothetical protein
LPVTGNTYGPPPNGGVTRNGRCASAPGKWNSTTPVTNSGSTIANAGRNAAVGFGRDAPAFRDFAVVVTGTTRGFAVVVTGATRRFASTAGGGARAGRPGSVTSEGAADEVVVVAAAVVVATPVVVAPVVVASAVVVVAAVLSVGVGVVVGVTSVVVATEVVSAVVVTTSGLETVPGGAGVSSAPTRSGTASAKLATASHAPATTARRNLGIAHTYQALRRRCGAPL